MDPVTAALIGALLTAFGAPILNAISRKLSRKGRKMQEYLDRLANPADGITPADAQVLVSTLLELVKLGKKVIKLIGKESEKSKKKKEELEKKMGKILDQELKPRNYPLRTLLTDIPRIFGFSEKESKGWKEVMSNLLHGFNIEERIQSAEERQYLKDAWDTLANLAVKADSLWKNASPQNFDLFLKQLDNFAVTVERSRIFVDLRHYTQLKEVISQFESYRIGKAALVDYKQQLASRLGDDRLRTMTFKQIYKVIPDHEKARLEQDIKQYISENRRVREEYKDTIKILAKEFGEFLNSRSQ
jgi:hypothetical protein